MAGKQEGCGYWSILLWALLLLATAKTSRAFFVSKKYHGDHDVMRQRLKSYSYFDGRKNNDGCRGSGRIIGRSQNPSHCCGRLPVALAPSCRRGGGGGGGGVAVTRMFATTTNSFVSDNGTIVATADKSNAQQAAGAVTTPATRTTTTSEQSEREEQDLVELLRSMIQELKRISPSRPLPWKREQEPEYSTRTCNYILSRWSQEGLSGARAEDLLRSMMRQQRQLEQQNEQSKIFAVAPDVITLNTVLDAYAKQGTHENSKNNNNHHHFLSNNRRAGPEQAQEQLQKSAIAAHSLLQDWQTLYERSVAKVDANRISFNTVLSAYARAGSVDGAQAVFDELRQRHEQQQQDHDAYQPDAHSYGSLLHAHAVAGQVDEAGALLRQMQQPDSPVAPTVHCYNEVLYAHAQSQRPGSALEFFQWWMDEQQQQQQQQQKEQQQEVPSPETHSYNMVLHALAQMSRMRNSGNDHAVVRSDKVQQEIAAHAEQVFASIVQPDAVSYTTLVAVFCQCCIGKTALAAVNRVLQQAWKDTSITGGRKGAAFASNVLYSLSTIRESNNKDRDGSVTTSRSAIPIFAEQLVRTMAQKQVATSPNVNVFNALLYCWAKSGDRGAGKRALAILSRLEKDGRYRPNSRTYATVLDALAKSSGADPDCVGAAEDLVRRMEGGELLGAGGVAIAPDVRAYTALIQTYARSRHLPFKAEKAAAVLRRMKKRDDSAAQPNIVTYNAVLNAAEHTNVYSRSDPMVVEDALKVAFRTFDEIRTRANHVTYGSFLGVLGNLMPPSSEERKEMVQLVFKRCCAEGYVSSMVLQKLSAATETDDEYYEKLLEGYDEDSLPASWTRNVAVGQ